MFNYTLDIDNQSIIDMIQRTFNHVDPRIINHGSRVSYLVCQFMLASGTDSDRDLRDISTLAILHDIGAYKTEEINRLIQFELGYSWNHSVYGYLFLKYFSPFTELAPVILHHHTPYQRLLAEGDLSKRLQRLAQIMMIADRMDIFLTHGYTQEGYNHFIQYLKSQPNLFNHEIVHLLEKIDVQPLIDGSFQQEASYRAVMDSTPYTVKEYHSFFQMLTFSFDFRSHHTVTHTVTTTAISQELARLFHLSPQEINDIVCGATLHDLGKIGIPTEILEFPGKLSEPDMAIMRTHVDLTRDILGDSVLPVIREIALRHHEKLDGSGYPAGLTAEDLTVSQRILAVADIVSALTGTRSYKDSYSKDKTLFIIEDMARRKLIDRDIVTAMIDGYEPIMETVTVKTTPVLDSYQAIQKEYQELLDYFSG